MALTTRQNNIYASEDWRVIYQSFINADFQSYDFETLRKSMFDYIRAHYSEDFNDLLESSEFVALVDLIAYLGQNLSYRVDLNARENYLGTAERRESVLRLARLVSYNAKRNTTASGLLKLTDISTTENVFDSNGSDLSNRVITWNDPNNSNYVEHFNLVLNAAMVSTQRVGNPNLRGRINGVDIEQYQINIPVGSQPLYNFSETIDSVSMDFQIVNAAFEDELRVYEESPSSLGSFGILYRNDGRGNGSKNTGFFSLFKQGNLLSADFTYTDAIPNRIQPVNSININQDDVWLYELNSNGFPQILWQQVPAVNGNNVIFNSLSNDIRKMYSVTSRENDMISFIFGDGVFSDIPRGNFRGYFRQSNGLDYIIKTSDIQNVTINVPYVSKLNVVHTMSMTFNLQQNITNASRTESLDDIRTNAPLHYYTQDRMVNGEDYNIFPITHTNNIIKTKAVNRVSSGISKYFDIVDPTSKYSSTNVFAEDGVIYREYIGNTFDFTFNNEVEILQIIRDRIEPILTNVSSIQFYLDQYSKIDVTDTIIWNQLTSSTNQSTGYFSDGTDEITIGDADGATGDAVSLKNNSLVQFSAPTNKHFKENGRLANGPAVGPNTFTSIWSLIKNVSGDGAGHLSDGSGKVTLSEMIGDGAIVDYIIPQFDTNISSELERKMLEKIRTYESFALRYDHSTYEWDTVTNPGSVENDFDSTSTSDGWLIKLDASNNVYTVTYRGLEYYFESIIENRFYFDDSVKIFNPSTGKTIRDQIKIHKSNSKPDSNEALDKDNIWQIYGLAPEFDGSQNSRKVLITFIDSDDDGIPDDPDQFENLVKNESYVVYERESVDDGYQITNKLLNFDYATADVLPDLTDTNIKIDFIDGEVLYLTDSDEFRIYDGVNNEYTTPESDKFIAYTGRQNISFNYKHNSSSERRINPGKSNLMDMYILTRAYSDLYQRYINDDTGVLIEPDTDSSIELYTQFNSLLDHSILSDDLIFHPVKYKPLFGTKAESNLQAIFKIVKNVNLSVTDTEIKTRTVAAINEYFNINNWDFGETFYFTELSAYIHLALSPLVSTVIIVPRGNNQVFGSLFEIRSESNEIFISDAKVNDIEIIDQLTATKLRTNGAIATG